MEITSVINQMLILLIILVVGVVAAKLKVINTETNKALSAIVINIAQCAMILSSVINVELTLSPLELLELLGIAAATYAVLIAYSFIAPTVLRVGPEERGVYQFASIFGNCGFMGFPVIASIFGPEAVFYASLFNIPFNVLAYSLGIRLISGGEKVRFQWRRLINPPMVSTVIAIILILTKPHVPVVLEESVSLLGNMVVPSAMLIIGGSLGALSFREVFGEWKTYPFLPFKLIAAPIIVWAILRLFVRDETILGIATVLASLPVATNTTMLCIQYGGNEKAASRLVFVSTVVSVVTIPIMVYFLLT